MVWWILGLAWASDPVDDFTAGVRLQVERGDHAAAAARYDAACAAGHQPACSNLASQLVRGLGVPADVVRAAQLHRRACEAELAISCDALGTLATLGLGRPADDADALALYRRACDLGHATGCAHLGRMLDGGFGAPRDWPAAHAAYGRACDGDDAETCWSLGRKLLGLRRADLAPEAIARTDRACVLGVADACLALATELDAGSLVGRDPKRARALRARACTLGHAACRPAP